MTTQAAPALPPAFPGRPPVARRPLPHPRAPRAASRASQAASRFPRWSRAAILCILGCLLIPRGVELQLGSIMIDPSRVLLALFGCYAVSQLLAHPRLVRWNVADLLMLVHVGIIAFSAIYHDGFDEGLENCIATIVDMGLAYLVARAAVSRLASYHYCLRVLLFIAAVCGFFGIIESFTGHSLIRAAYQLVFPRVGDVIYGQRLGLNRATGTFRVDILFGLFCMSVFALTALVPARRLGIRPITRRIGLALTLAGVFFSLSSGPWLGLMLSLFFFLYDHALRSERNRWKLLVGTALGLLTAASVASGRGPFKLVIDYLSLDPLSGYVRLAMYESVSKLVPDYWPLGWGWGDDWPRVEWYTWTSIDCFYADMFVKAGAIAVLAFVAFVVYSISSVGARPAEEQSVRPECRGWAVALTCLSIVIITVDIFGNFVFYAYFLAGAGQVLRHASADALPTSRRTAPSPARAGRTHAMRREAILDR